MPFLDANKLIAFSQSVTLDEAYYQGGQFQTETKVPDAYSTVPPKVRCLTRAWPHNISQTARYVGIY